MDIFKKNNHFAAYLYLVVLHGLTLIIDSFIYKLKHLKYTYYCIIIRFFDVILHFFRSKVFMVYHL